MGDSGAERTNEIESRVLPTKLQGWETPELEVATSSLMPMRLAS